MKRLFALFLTICMTLCTMVSCGPKVPPPSNDTDSETVVTPVPPSEEELAVKESPSLTELVSQGALPPLEERLPDNPLVIKPYSESGKYGGTWQQTVTIGTKGHAMNTIGYYSGFNLITWNMDKSDIEPNLAESYEMDDECKVLTVTLRKGLKWSDGEPMTTADVEFWWKAYANDKTVSPTNNEWEGVTLEIVDEQTFIMRFPEPRPFQLMTMAEMSGSYCFFPKHYLAQFHGEYNSEADKLAKSLQFDRWVDCFLDRQDYLTNADLPTMTPWTLATDGSAATQLVFERNPYYWAVDTEGRQLPYIDSCIVNIAESIDSVKIKVVSGEFDIAFATIAEDFSDYPLYAEYMEEAGYEIRTSDYDEPGALNIHLNMTNKDAEKRSFMEKVEFRQAMSLALNRPEIVSVNYTIGSYESTIRQFSPYPGSPYYDEEMSTQYTEYDVETANSMLDALGLDKKNSEGMRLLPSGNVFSIVIDVPAYSDQWMDVAVMIADYWKQVGINASARSVDPSLWDSRCTSNDFDCTVMTGAGGFATLTKTSINDLTGYNFYSWPHRFNSGNYSWRDGTDGIEPLPVIKRLWELGSALAKETDTAKQQEMIDEILQIHKDNLFILGVCTRLPALYLVKNYMKNVPPLDPSWSFGYSGHGRPEQYYMDQ